jgi:hypothetical protein
VKALGAIPNEPCVDCCSVRSGGRSRGWAFSVMVLEVEPCDGDDDRWGAARCVSDGGCGCGTDDSSPSSGFAMRSPPSVCDRFMSPFIVAAGGQYRRYTGER